MRRTRIARAAAERALVRLALRLGTHAGELVVIGGLNADLLTTTTDVPHQGTTDIDLFIGLAAVYERDDDDFSWLEHALEDAGFHQDVSGGAWRWNLDVDGTHVRLDLLTDVHDHPGQEIVLPGTSQVTSQNIPGPGAATTDARLRVLEVDPRDRRDGTETVELRFVGLGGYVLAKAAAVLGRDEPKDCYDLAFVLLHNADGGPAAAGRAAAAALQTVATLNQRATLEAALGRFESIDSEGARTYARQRLHDGVDEAEDVLAQDAVAAARDCRRAFRAAQN